MTKHDELEALARDEPKQSVCTCGQMIVHVKDEFWRLVGSGELCVDGHWHRPAKGE